MPQRLTNIGLLALLLIGILLPAPVASAADDGYKFYNPGTTTSASRKETGFNHSLYVGTGIVGQGLFQSTSNAQKAVGFLTAANITLRVSGAIPLFKGLNYTPSFNYHLLPRNMADNAGRVITFVATPLDFSYAFNPVWAVNLGLGLWFEHRKHNGGTTQVDEGGTLATFGRPEISILTRLATLQAGISVRISNRMRWDVQLLTYGTFNSRFTMSFLTHLTWGLI